MIDTNRLMEAVKEARYVTMSGEERMEQRIDFAHGNLPEDMISSSKDLMKRTDDMMRSPGGWDIASTVQSDEPIATE